MAREKATILTTEKVRLNLPHLITPHLFEGSAEAQFITQVMIPKSDKTTVQKFLRAVKEQAAKGFPSGLPSKFINPLKDGKAYAKEKDLDVDIFGDYIIFKAKSKKAWPPQVVGPNPKVKMTDEALIYSGCNARVGVTCKFYDNMSKGVGFYLSLVQILPGGESIVSKPDADSFFNQEADFGDEALDTNELSLDDSSDELSLGTPDDLSF